MQIAIFSWCPGEKRQKPVIIFKMRQFSGFGDRFRHEFLKASESVFCLFLASANSTETNNTHIVFTKGMYLDRHQCHALHHVQRSETPCSTWTEPDLNFLYHISIKTIKFSWWVRLFGFCWCGVHESIFLLFSSGYPADIGVTRTDESA